MREIRSSGSVEGVMGNHDSYSDTVPIEFLVGSAVRTTMRRYTRLSNGFSRKLRNHRAAVALNYFAYNFVKINRSLRMSPAMAAGVTPKLWEVSDIVALLEASESKKAA